MSTQTIDGAEYFAAERLRWSERAAMPCTDAWAKAYCPPGCKCSCPSCKARSEEAG